MTAAVEIEDLAKVFGGLRAVDGVSLSVAPGERRALIGPNGAGKTTLFHCVTGTLQASSGRVKLFGHDVTHMPEHRRTKLGMGRTFQITNVFTDLSLTENLALSIIGHRPAQVDLHRPLDAFPAIRAQALAGLEAVGLKDRADHPVRLLSYGERRQLELALALNTGPKVLFLDEPCAGLSPSERQRIFSMIRGAAARHHGGPDRARHGRGARPCRPRDRDAPRARDGGGNARGSAGQPASPRRVFRPCLTASLISATCSEPLLAVSEIHTYYGDSYVLQGVSLTLHKGQIAAILGRNGMGKTTLIRSVAGLTPPRTRRDRLSRAARCAASRPTRSRRTASRSCRRAGGSSGR